MASIIGSATVGAVAAYMYSKNLCDSKVDQLNTTANNNLTECNSKIGSCTSQLKDVEKDRDSFQTMVSQKESENAALASQNAQLIQENARLDSIIKDLMAKNSNLSNESLDKSNSIVSLNKSYTQSLTDLKALHVEFDKIKEAYDTVSSEYDRLKLNVQAALSNNLPQFIQTLNQVGYDNNMYLFSNLSQSAVFENKIDRVKMLTELKTLVSLKTFSIVLEPTMFVFDNEREILSTYSIYAFIAFLVKCVYELKLKNLIK